ncbi:hypothetical protein [Streptomyces zhihengii]|uniref:hypothetical protein n=1 Tax=Streptomyces zhihengii TaxID=1818004 RepID=UPI003F4C48E1
MTAVNRPENLFEGIRPAQYQETLRDFPEHAEEVARRVAAMSPQDVETAQRERTAQMILLGRPLPGGALPRPAAARVAAVRLGAVRARFHGRFPPVTAARARRPADGRAGGSPVWR